MQKNGLALSDVLSHTLKMRAGTLLFLVGWLFLKAAYYGYNGYGHSGYGMPSGAGIYALVALMWMAAIGLVENRRRALRGHKFVRIPFVRKPGKLGAWLVGLSLVFAFWVPPTAPLFLIPGALGGYLFWVSMGRLVEDIEPVKKPDIDFQARRISELTEKATGLIAETLAASRKFNDPALENRLRQLGDKTVALLGSLEAGTGNVAHARKFVTVYLQSTRDATVMFANFYARNRDEASKQKYEVLLSDLEAFVKKRDGKVLETERALLDIEFETLRERMKVEL